MNKRTFFTLLATSIAAALPIHAAPAKTPPASSKSAASGPAWGEAVNGLQLGITANTPGPRRVGEQAFYTLTIRNESKNALTLQYFRPILLTPTVLDAQGKLVVIFTPVFNGAVLPVVKEIAPGEAFEYARGTIGIEPANLDQSVNWGQKWQQIGVPVIGAAPGKHTVSYALRFDKLDAASTPKNAKAWDGTLKSGTLTLEVIAAK